MFPKAQGPTSLTTIRTQDVLVTVQSAQLLVPMPIPVYLNAPITRALNLTVLALPVPPATTATSVTLSASRALATQLPLAFKVVAK